MPSLINDPKKCRMYFNNYGHVFQMWIILSSRAEFHSETIIKRNLSPDYDLISY